MTVRKEVVKKIDERDTDTKQILVMTKEQADAVKYWKRNQLVLILDEIGSIPTIGGNLPEGLTSVTAAQLNATNARINRIVEILEYWGLAVQE